MKSKRLNHLVTGVWVANIAICLLVTGLFVWSKTTPPAVGIALSTREPTRALPASIPVRASITPVPPPTRRPTITPWPTPIPGPSMTPMLLPPTNRIVIGYSIENRPLEVFRFGQGRINKLILAGIHGGSEWNTIELADQLITYFTNNLNRIPKDTTLFILRDLNPDGTARAHGVDGRVNANGVDLNHNWPYHWKADWPRDGCWIWRKVTGGASAGSEPEVQTLISFIDKIKPEALISYHSAALGIFPGGKPDFAPSISLAASVAEVSNYPYPPIDTGCDYSGNLTDWAANTRGIPSVDIELTNHSNTDFDQNLRVLQAFLTWQR